MTTRTFLTLVEPEVLERLQNDIDKEIEFKKKLREHLDDLDRQIRKLMAAISMIHVVPKEQLPEIDVNMEASSVKSENSSTYSIQETLAAIQELADQHPYHKYNGMWTRQMENLSFCFVFLYWLGSSRGNRKEGKLLSYKEVANEIGVPTDEEENKFHLSIEEYLHSLISLINELARLAVNSVTMGNYERPLEISRFVKELSTAFQILNLKNDNLRKRFDSIKYDVKKIEEVVYDLSLRGLIPKKSEAKGDVASAEPTKK